MISCVPIINRREHKFKEPINIERLYAEEHIVSGAKGIRRAASPTGSPRGLGRFAFNRNPRAANTPACVPRRYEFIVYTERPSSSYTQTNCTGGKLQRLYSSNGSCIAAACAPLQYKARSIVHAYTYINARERRTRSRNEGTRRTFKPGRK